MQIYIRKQDAGSQQDVSVVAFYEDGIVVPDDAHPDTVRISLADSKFVEMREHAPVLKKGWRSRVGESIDAEAGRRIEEVFPDWQQRNAVMMIASNTIKYGADVAGWPASERDKVAEFNRGCDYIEAVRAQSNLLKKQKPAVPSDPSHWPGRQDKIKV